MFFGVTAQSSLPAGSGSRHRTLKLARMIGHLMGLEADTVLSGWSVRLAKGPLDG
jgi:hypothetical protein